MPIKRLSLALFQGAELTMCFSVFPIFLEGLGLILMAGCLPHLQVLDLTYNWSKTEGNLEGVLAAMRDGRCPALVDLRLMNCSLSLPEVVLVGQIVAEQSCPDLEHLSLSGENAGNGLEGLMDALASGFGARLKTLALDSCPVKGREGELLVRALTTGQCRNLEILGLDNCVSEPEVCLGVLEAMKLDHLPHLRLLDFSCAPFPVQHVPLLIEVLKERRCPGLEAVDVIVKEPWGDAMAAAVIEAIIEGGYQMKELQLGDVAMANGSAQVLCLALALPAWKNITRLELRLNHDLGDANMAMILRRLLPRRFLTSLVANDTRMGEEAGQVLLQGLQSGAWPRLKILNIMDTSWGPEVTEGIVDLIESRQLESLEVLCMSDMAVTEECCWKLATAFESGACSRLTGFCMNGLDVGVDWEEVFASRPEPVEVQ